jgi:ADP-ribosylglycohydrolase
MISKKSAVAEKMQNWLKRRPWLAGDDVVIEQQQAQEEGRDLSAVQSKLKRLVRTQKEFRFQVERLAMVDQIAALPFRPGFAKREPSDLASIRKVRPKRPKLATWKGSRQELTRRLHGALAGRIAGCLLGKPVECWRKDKIESAFALTGNWPIDNYLRFLTKAELKRAGHESKPENLQHWKKMRPMLRGHIDGMVEDDDINYTVLGWLVLKKFGAKFSPCDVLQAWYEQLPYFHVCTAEISAYRNGLALILPPESATHRNPYREWIGAQIRADFFGYASPGKPEQAATWAWRDASISHVKNGIYGEMWVAAMLAATYVENDWLKILQVGLAQIPRQCRLRAEIDLVVTDYRRRVSYEEAVTKLHQRWDEVNWHHWCHTIPNAAVVTLGLLYGEDDYEKTITRAVMAAFDTDCNGATCGSLWGMKHGVKALPRKWMAPLNDRVRTGLADCHDSKIAKLAESMVETVLQVNA